MHEPVDAVITWVDGYDPVHRHKLESYLGGIDNTNIASTRFNQHGEIHYCVRSLLYFAPWIRTIYIVTDNQIPLIVNDLGGSPYAEKIQVIDHKTIFLHFEEALPTFNSLTIESLIWRIPNLSDHFIYLNDDCFLVSPVRKEDFIHNNKIVLRGEWKIHTERKWRNRLKNLFSQHGHSPIVNEHRHIQEKSAKLVGYNKRFFHLPHCPFFLRKKTLENFFAKYPNLLSKNVTYRLRDLEQFWTISLAMHLEIHSNNVLLDNNLQAITVNPACHSLNKIQSRLSQVTKKRNIAFVCMQSIDVGSESTQHWMLNWLSKHIPSINDLSLKHK
ncbi:Capsular polysaccharide phosphotransferase SacB [Legionella lansingensis]|uniref:Capsular polysaccharide phosphotransferase cps12A n=1 Tax=Legionella lansingensis TaxID=45067 RepID=A0A0W0V7Y6_9GAMM|nr:stealth family protein [Legionella lansingensis]KTD15981.1 Capsular polysaccharide phosphotransferase cps12A [Legionella lansingensis]SNV56509.1 Capsular polysaccharide phosphotransferase SacB [Legionella lansingensis]